MTQFGTTPLSTTTLGANQFPVSAAFVPNSNAQGNLTSIEGIAVNTDSNGFKTTAIRLGLKDGDDATKGLTTDAAVTGDTSGTISAKLRGLNKILANLTFDGSNFLKINVAAGAVTANIGTTNGLALDTSVNGLQVSQGSTTSGEKGTLIQGAVTSSAPSYTTAQTSPLSLTLAGALRVDASATTQPVSGTVTANQGSANATPWNENIAQVGAASISLGSKTSANSFPVVIASDQVAIPIQHGSLVDAGNSSTATLGSNAAFTGTSTSSLNYSALSLEVFADQASAAGGLSVQQSQNGTNWDIVDTFSISASTAFNTVVNLIGQNYRIVYTNGGTAQGTFRLQTVKMVADPVLPRTLTAAGNLRVDGSAVTQPVSGTFWQATQPVSGTVTANQGGAPWSENITQFGGTNLSTGTGAGGAGIPRITVSNDSSLAANQSVNVNQIGGTNVVTGGASGLMAVGGPVASAGTNADNPVKIGGVFNTTQPTVTNGQIVDAQTTARGAQIVATGVDTFNATINAALPTGANTIGAVTQASGPWTSNVTQFGGTNISTGTGAGGAGIPRVTISNDSSLAANQSVNVAQFGGTNTVTGTGASGSGIPRMTVSNDSQVQLWDGTNKANVMASTSVSSAVGAQAAQLTAGAFAENASLTAGSLNADLVAALDVSNYKSFTLQINGTWSGTLSFQCSNDNTTYFAMGVYSFNSYSQVSTTTANGLFTCQTSYRYLRVRMTSYTSGTATGILELYTSLGNPLTLGAAQSGTWTVMPGNTANTTPWLVKPHDGTNPLFLAAATLANGISNPTVGGIANFPTKFNGSTWDVEHNNWNTTTGDSGTKTATFNGATQTNYDARGAMITVLLGTVSGTSPTLACQLQWSPDAGTTWLNIGAALANLTATNNTGTIWAYPTNSSTAGATPAALTTGATQTLQLNMPLPKTWRLTYTIGGTSPSFAISSVQVNYIL